MYVCLGVSVCVSVPMCLSLCACLCVFLFLYVSVSVCVYCAVSLFVGTISEAPFMILKKFPERLM